MCETSFHFVIRLWEYIDRPYQLLQTTLGCRGRYTLSVVCMMGMLGYAIIAKGGEWTSPITWTPDVRAVQSGLYIQPQPLTDQKTVSFTITEFSGVARQQWPVRGAIPMYRGELSDPIHIRLRDAVGNEIPVQGHVTAFWPEKTARFLCLDFLTNIEANQTKSFTLEYGTAVTSATNSSLQVTSRGSTTIIDTGEMTLFFRPGTQFLQVTLQNPTKVLRPVSGRATIATNAQGANPASHALHVDNITVVEQGSVQTTVHLLGHYGAKKSSYHGRNNVEDHRYPASLYFRIYGNTGRIYVEHTFGYNGDEYADFVKSYGLTIPTSLSDGKFFYGPDATEESEAPLGVRLNQYAHNEWTLAGNKNASGRRFGGWGAIKGDDIEILVAMREAWQNWPVAISAQENGDLVYEILGEKDDRALDLRYMDPYEPNRQEQQINHSHSMENGDLISDFYTNTNSAGRATGIRKIHELFLDFKSQGAGSAVGRAFQKPLVPWSGVHRFANTKALGHIAVYGDPDFDHYKHYFSVLLDAYPVIHEANGLYGWVDWGDVPMFDQGIIDGKFQLLMQGGLGWSNGERALAAYFFHYAAGGGKRFLDLGRTMVHHTLGIDVEHSGGDYTLGSYHRHDQVHWREQGFVRQGGFRGWHVYYWLTGDPEVRRMALLEGIDAPAHRTIMDVSEDQLQPIVKTSEKGGVPVYFLAHESWITTGDWRYARAHHAINRLWEICGIEERIPAKRDNFMTVVDGEPVGYELGDPGPLRRRWLTYSGADVAIEWGALTGDPAAVNTILYQGAIHTPPSGFWKRPDSFYVGLALLNPHHPELKQWLEGLVTSATEKFKSKGYTTTGEYASAETWANYGVLLDDKNGFSIYGSEALAKLYWIYAWKLLKSAGTN